MGLRRSVKIRRPPTTVIDRRYNCLNFPHRVRADDGEEVGDFSEPRESVGHEGHGHRTVELDHEAVFLEPAGDGAGKDFSKVEFALRKHLQHGDEAARGVRELEDEAGVGGPARARQGRADDDEGGLVGDFRADFTREDFQAELRDGLLARDGGGILFLRGERRGHGGTFDDDLLGLRVMLLQPRAAVVEGRAVRVNLAHSLGPGTREEHELDAHGERLADLQRAAIARPRQPHELVGRVGDNAAGGIFDRHNDLRELALFQPREGFLDGGAFRQRGLGKSTCGGEVREAALLAEITDAHTHSAIYERLF
jgi:hypothetical protein